VLEFYGLRMFIKLLAVPKHILLPIILVLCVVGAFGLNSRIFDVWAVLLFGLLGYGFVKSGLPIAPFIIGFILGPMAETNLRRGLMLSDGSFGGFLTNPISAGFLVLAVASISWHLVTVIRNRKSAAIELMRS
jgi:putative tricarboxylic transport membrane protein